MNSVQALGRLRALGKPAVTTDDVVVALRMRRPATSRLLGRLADAGLVLKVRHGLWSLDPQIDPLLVPENLTAPYPAYVSLQTALYLHGMISQVPEVIYVASLAPPRRVRTNVGTFSIHRLAPTFFGGFDTAPSGVRLAKPEKALLDTLYLIPAKSRLFAHLPEVELPDHFDERAARAWVRRIREGPRRTMVSDRLEAFLSRLPRRRPTKKPSPRGAIRAGSRESR